MSARPRPVTATFKPKSMAPPTGVRTRSYSLSSGSSTESLVSVLDHDSYESLGDESEQESKADVKVSSVDNIDSQSHLVSTTQTYETETSPFNQKPQGIQAWEKWMVDKAKELRLKQKRESLRVKEEKDKELKIKKVKEEKLKVGEEKVKDWIERKILAEKLHKKMNIRQEKVQCEVGEENKKQFEDKCQAKFLEWMEEKMNKEKEQKRLVKEKKKKEEQEKEKRQKQCQQAFEKWSRDAQQRPKSSHSSLGYTSGKLTGYHNTCSYPMPSFVNPIPWKPVEIPKPKTARKRPNSVRKKWNPDKYF